MGYNRPYVLKGPRNVNQNLNHQNDRCDHRICANRTLLPRHRAHLGRRRYLEEITQVILKHSNKDGSTNKCYHFF